MTKIIVHLTIEGSIEMEEDVRLPLNSNIGNRLKELRKSRGLTLMELSNMSEVSASGIARIEKGERLPSGITIGKLERALSLNEG